MVDGLGLLFGGKMTVGSLIFKFCHRIVTSFPVSPVNLCQQDTGNIKNNKLGVFAALLV